MAEGALLAVRDILDGQLETRDHQQIGRVDDALAEMRLDGSLVLTHLVTGPEALAGRVSTRLRPVTHFLLRGRFDDTIPISEVEEVGPTVRLRGTVTDYATGRSERWVADHILRFIPGNGRS